MSKRRLAGQAIPQLLPVSRETYNLTGFTRKICVRQLYATTGCWLLAHDRRQANRMSTRSFCRRREGTILLSM